MRRFFVLMLVCFAVTMTMAAQGTASTTASAAAATGSLPDAKAYSADEFPPWMNSTRRFEIITLGVFPFALFYTRAAFDLYRFVDNNFEGSYAPWPFKNELSYKPTDDEQIRSLLVAGGLAVLFASGDALIQYLQNRNR
ncbi:MAG: hypothetical protein KKC64_11795 [Spirochaetes bacterium]|nr:hypothetical protein [Spirochaetota bacterium]